MVRQRSREWRKMQSPPKGFSQPTPNLRARTAILEVVENQLRDLTPPETKQTYDRLLAEGHSSDEAKRLIACALVNEMNVMIKENKFFNEERYGATLERLPRMPWD
jgi:hypothetical protein